MITPIYGERPLWLAASYARQDPCRYVHYASYVVHYASYVEADIAILTKGMPQRHRIGTSVLSAHAPFVGSRSSGGESLCLPD